MTPKAFYLSKTFWVNLITTVIALLTILPEQPVIPPEWQPYILLAVGILNVVLRFLTNQPISLSRK